MDLEQDVHDEILNICNSSVENSLRTLRRDRNTILDLNSISTSPEQYPTEDSSIISISSGDSYHSASGRANENTKNFENHLQYMQEAGISEDENKTHTFDHEIQHAPLFGSNVHSQIPPHFFVQYGLLGLQQEHYINGREVKKMKGSQPNLIYGNHGEPSSTFICGSQGSGKSYTLAAHLENCILPNSPIAKLPHPLPVMAFHYDSYTSATSIQHCELAYFCSIGVKVRVLTHSSNFRNMKHLYENLPGLAKGSPKPVVMRLKLREQQLNISNMMILMNVKESDGTPLYLAVLYEILQNMAETLSYKSGINYMEFKRRLAAQRFKMGQTTMLNLRLQLLESFLECTPFERSQGVDSEQDHIWNFEPGTLTIVDLSSPFVNAGDACAMFTVCLNLFMADRMAAGRVVALDEAHKFLTRSGEAEKLTEHLISIIRQQRHLATRVIIATQEPTLDPRLLDLCNTVIVHRFNSPAWFTVLQRHLAGSRPGNNDQTALDAIFKTILNLDTGTALVFSPTAVLHLAEFDQFGSLPCFGVAKLGDGYAKVKIRKRLTADGGRSIVASDRYHLPKDMEIEVSSHDTDSSSATGYRDNVDIPKPKPFPKYAPPNPKNAPFELKNGGPSSFMDSIPTMYSNPKLITHPQNKQT